MGRDNKKIDSIAVTEIARVTDEQDLLHPDFETGGTRPFFDGHIWVYKSSKQTNDNYSDRIPVQIKGHEVKRLSIHTCKYPGIKKANLEAYKKEAGILFFVVQILKKSHVKKIFWKQLLPYDIENTIKKMRRNSTSIELISLDRSNLTLVCQNFIRDKEKQKHGKIKPLGEIKGLEGLNLSVITRHPGKGYEALNDYIVAENPLYVYAIDKNDISFPLANLTNDDVHLMLHDTSEVWVGNVSYGNHYFSHQINENGVYYQFGSSWRFFLDGQTKFSATGTLDDRIKDIDFLLRVVNGDKIRVGDIEFPYKPSILPEQKIALHKVERGYKVLQSMKHVFDFLGMNSPIDITEFSKRDLHLMEILSEHVVDGKDSPTLYKEDGIKVLRIGNYFFLVLAYQGELINVFSSDYYKRCWGIFEMHDGTQTKVSPYYCLDAETIEKSSNFRGNVVMDSIRAFPYSSHAGGEYNNLLLEAIKAMDATPNNGHIVKFSNDLADYLLENEDTLVHRLNKIQVTKRFCSLDQADIVYLNAEREKQKDSKMLCGIAILLGDTALFNEHFAKLAQEQQTEFREYPIMKLLDRNE